jgi:hypothetical protein
MRLPSPGLSPAGVRSKFTDLRGAKRLRPTECIRSLPLGAAPWLALLTAGFGYTPYVGLHKQASALCNATYS